MPSRIILYDEPAAPEIDIANLARFAREIFCIPVDVCQSPFADADYDIFAEVASLRVINPRRPFQRYVPAPEEVLQESRAPQNIMLYDGFEMQQMLSRILPADELGSDTLSVVFTTRLTCTYDYDDCRYHGRAVIASNPSIISTTGILEAPAKPREYYLDMMQSVRMGLNEPVLRKKYEGTYLERNDPRMPRVVQGYLLQAAFYHITGEPFCDDPSCRLYNAHWQADLIHSQIESGRLCDYHTRMLECGRSRRQTHQSGLS